jgi:hypothetical protein
MTLSKLITGTVTVSERPLNLNKLLKMKIEVSPYWDFKWSICKIPRDDLFLDNFEFDSKINIGEYKFMDN